MALLSATLFAVFLFVACADSAVDVSPGPTVTPQAVTSVAAESEPPVDEGVFLRVIAPLDEARGYCLDIPGHASGVRVESPLQAHTCKHGIWNHDGRFDAASLTDGVLRMPYYELCLHAEDASAGARLVLAGCTAEDPRVWALQDAGEIVLAASQDLCITIAEGPGRDAGGPQYLMKGVGLDACSPQSADRQRWATTTPR